MATPLFAFFAGIGCVTGALGVGFAGAVALMDVQAPPKIPAATFGTPAPKSFEPPKVAEAPKGEALSLRSTFETSNPVSSAEATIKSLTFAPPAHSAGTLQSQEPRTSRAHEPVRRAHPRVISDPIPALLFDQTQMFFSSA